jgi:hypothetical protein
MLRARRTWPISRHRSRSVRCVTDRQFHTVFCGASTWMTRLNRTAVLLGREGRPSTLPCCSSSRAAVPAIVATHVHTFEHERGYAAGRPPIYPLRPEAARRTQQALTANCACCVQTAVLSPDDSSPGSDSIGYMAAGAAVASMMPFRYAGRIDEHREEVATAILERLDVPATQGLLGGLPGFHAARGGLP